MHDDDSTFQIFTPINTKYVRIIEHLNTITISVGDSLGVVISNGPILSLILASDPLVQIDVHQPLLTVRFCHLWKSRISSMPQVYSFTDADYLSLFRCIETFDCSNALAMPGVGRATETLTTIVKKAIDTLVPNRSTKPSEYTEWFSKDLNYYLLKNDNFTDFIKNSVFVLW